MGGGHPPQLVGGTSGLRARCGTTPSASAPSDGAPGGRRRAACPVPKMTGGDRRGNRAPPSSSAPRSRAVRRVRIAAVDSRNQAVYLRIMTPEPRPFHGHALRSARLGAGLPRRCSPGSSASHPRRSRTSNAAGTPAAPKPCTSSPRCWVSPTPRSRRRSSAKIVPGDPFASTAARNRPTRQAKPDHRHTPTQAP